MMHLYRKWILTLAALAVWTASARTDETKGGYVPNEESIEVMLLRHKPVRDDLKLGDAEAKKIQEFATNQWGKAKEVAALGEEKRHERFAGMAKENEKFLEDNLSAEQRKRLNQIAMQVAGLMFITRPEIASEINLTNEQKTKAREMQAQAHKEVCEILQADSKEGRQDKFRQLHKQCGERLQSLLTDDQKAIWKRLAGEKFAGELNEE